MTEQPSVDCQPDKLLAIAVEVALRTGLLKKCPEHGNVYDPGQHDFQGRTHGRDVFDQSVAPVGRAVRGRPTASRRAAQVDLWNIRGDLSRVLASLAPRDSVHHIARD